MITKEEEAQLRQELSQIQAQVRVVNEKFEELSVKFQELANNWRNAGEKFGSAAAQISMNSSGDFISSIGIGIVVAGVGEIIGNAVDAIGQHYANKQKADAERELLANKQAIAHEKLPLMKQCHPRLKKIFSRYEKTLSEDAMCPVSWGSPERHVLLQEGLKISFESLKEAHLSMRYVEFFIAEFESALEGKLSSNHQLITSSKSESICEQILLKHSQFPEKRRAIFSHFSEGAVCLLRNAPAMSRLKNKQTIVSALNAIAIQRIWVTVWPWGNKIEKSMFLNIYRSDLGTEQIESLAKHKIFVGISGFFFIFSALVVVGYFNKIEAAWEETWPNRIAAPLSNSFFESLGHEKKSIFAIMSPSDHLKKAREAMNDGFGTHSEGHLYAASKHLEAIPATSPESVESKKILSTIRSKLIRSREEFAKGLSRYFKYSQIQTNGPEKVNILIITPSCSNSALTDVQKSEENSLRNIYGFKSIRCVGGGQNWAKEL